MNESLECKAGVRAHKSTKFSVTPRDGRNLYKMLSRFKVWWNFDKVQIIFKAITGSLVTPLGGKESALCERKICHKNREAGRCLGKFSLLDNVRDLNVSIESSTVLSHQKAWPELPVVAFNIVCILTNFNHTSIVKASNTRKMLNHPGASLSE